MGRSASCFKIISCGGDSVGQDELDLAERKGYSDKRGWSFRKRSARHRVLSNTVVSEIPSSGNKESPESAAINFQTPVDSTIPEKTSVPQWADEKLQLSTSFNSKASETVVASENESKVDVNVDESAAIAIQAAVRGFLAQRALLKLKNVIKLQAAVRGHLVRRHAVGTLRVVQAIVKIQARVRARRVQAGKLDDGKDKPSSKPMEKENSSADPSATYTSIDKLLSNGFARQLLESNPRTKSIHIKCDPSRPNSGWQWLERWMSVSSSNLGQPQIPVLEKEELEHERVENSAVQVETGITSETTSESEDLKSNVRETAVPSESEENLITYDAESFDFQTCCPTSSSVKDNLELPPSENTGGTSHAKDSPSEIDLLPNHTMQPEEKSLTEFNSVSGKSEMESEQPKRSVKRFASEQLETEGKKFVFGSRKVSNPAFVAAQSKFEELSSTANSGRLISPSHQDVGVESNIETVSSAADTSITTKDLNTEDNSIPPNSRLQVGGSECGTELSITSTLDSPDISEVGAMEFDNEAKVSEEVICNLNSTGGLDVESKDVSTIAVSNLSDTMLAPPEKRDAVNGEPVNSVVDVDSSQVKQKPERTASDLQIELDPQTGRQAYRSSPEASPRSHITVPESQGTPSSQVSVKAKRSKTDKSGSNQKRASLSAGKRSPSNPNHDSGARSSMEQLPKDQKTGKRRNSFGSTRPDNVDQEPRDSSSSNSLPSYMQATESARAKLHANNSPRSSPDVQDKDIYIKKRHSLPGANGRQGSPRIQRSMSQAQQGAKGNGANPPHERKWQR